MKNLKELGFSNYCLTKDGKIYSLYINRFMKPWLNCSGYLATMLLTDNGTAKNVTVHRLLAETFINNPENKTQVNHIDGNKLNNDLSNLEWATPSENTQHANDVGLRKQPFLTELNEVLTKHVIVHDWKTRGITNLADDQVHKICQLLQDGYRACDVSRMTGFDRRFVQYIRDDSKEKWHHIVQEYDFSKIRRKEVTNPETVLKICEMLQNGIGVLQIAKELQCDRKLVGNIKNRKTYVTISSSYIF